MLVCKLLLGSTAGQLTSQPALNTDSHIVQVGTQTARTAQHVLLSKRRICKAIATHLLLGDADNNCTHRHC